MLHKKILLCVTGGIAAFKAVLLLRLLTKAGAEVRVVMSKSATRFVGPLTFEALCNHPVQTDLWQTGGGGESHILLTDWADLVAVVPATANTLARMAQGMADDLIGATLLAARGPVLVAPAMHTRMLNHPATQANLALLRRRGVKLVDPVEGELASGLGAGRMAEPEQIFAAIQSALTVKDLLGLRIVVTAGPTLEALDPVRFISNHSTGKMGYAIARAARLRGADVTLISGPSALKPPAEVETFQVKSAADMYSAVMTAYSSADVIVMSAAVADYTPSIQASEKLKKKDELLSIVLVPTVDILATLGKKRQDEGRGPVLVGFAMETQDLLHHAQEKLERKGCDLIVANNLKEEGAGFAHDTNRVTLVARGGQLEPLPLMSKDEVAWVLLERIRDLAERRRTGASLDKHRTSLSPQPLAEVT